jgi:hypothetical protein
LVPPALVGSTVALTLCSVGWGALGVFSLPMTDDLPLALHRYLCILLATLTICGGMVNLSARIVRAIREERGEPAVCGYVEGYADGLEAAPVSPAVARLVPSRR